MVLQLLLCVLCMSIVSPSGAQENCGNTDFVGTFGFISSPNYPDDYDNDLECTYTIFAPAGSSHTLIFLDFDVEEHFDYVEVSCATNASFATITYTGYDVPPATSIPWCASGQIFLFTDDSQTFTGFNIQYQTSTGGCGNTAFTTPTGFITSPNYPLEHDNNQNCSSVIWAPAKTSITIQFDAFSLQDDCSADWVEIRCIDDNSFYGRFCGISVPQDITIDQCQQVLVWFQSDATIVDAGFSAQYSMIMPSRGNCGQTDFNETSGVITSGNFPDDYENNLRCFYTIYSTTGSTHTLTFEAFTLEGGYDFIEVYCASNVSFNRIRYSGIILPPVTIIPWCADAQIYFYTDSTIAFEGFSIAYEVTETSIDVYDAYDVNNNDDSLCGDLEFNGTSGNINSPGFPGDNYYNDLDCSYVISAETPSYFNLYFYSFQLQSCSNCDCDFLEVRCLDDETDYGRYCGNELPPRNMIAVNQTCSNLLVWFFTDDDVVDFGFQLEYVVSDENPRKQ